MGYQNHDQNFWCCVSGFVMNRKAFTLIELLVVVALIGILAAVGVVAYNGYTKGAKNTVLKNNHQAAFKEITKDIVVGENNGKLERYTWDKGAIIIYGKGTGQHCRVAFDQGVLQQHFYYVGLKDPFFVKPSAWGNRKVMDTGAVWAGPPSGSYKIGKTFVQNIGNQLKMTTYMSDGVTKLENIIDIPNC